MAKRKQSSVKRVIIALVAIAVLSAIGVGVSFYLRFTAPNVKIPADHESYLYVSTGTTFDQLVQLVHDKKIVKRSESFRWVALKLKLDENIHPGRYKIKNGMSNLDLVRLLRSGRQTPVKLVLSKYRTKQDLAGAVSRKLEIDSLVFLTALNDDVYLQRFQVTPQEAMAIFVPNTYEFYWNTPLDKFFIKMAEEHEKFWSETRKQKAESKALTPIEATVLASIVEEETNVNAEKDEIASVYLNRLRKGMLLQADPTVKYAVGNFALRRVLHVHTSYISPYNTYVTPGLPPGPICTPSPKTIDAVLNAGETDYLFFCADPDRIGYHLFASNYKEHQLNAERYRRSLNRRGIR